LKKQQMDEAGVRRSGGRRRNFDFMAGRFPEGTFVRIDAALAAGETRADFVRVAVENELALRLTKPKAASRDVGQQPHAGGAEAVPTAD
jgi:hypothetical protein